MNRAKAEALLRQMLGADKVFRDGQWEAIESVALRKQRVLGGQPTSLGQRLSYLLSSKVLGGPGRRPSLANSPSPGPAANPSRAAWKKRLHPHTINSENRDDWAEAETA